MNSTSKKAVYTIIDKSGGGHYWLRIGWAHVNHDGSYNLHLDALPINGKLQVRDWQPRDDYAPRQSEVPAPTA